MCSQLQTHTKCLTLISSFGITTLKIIQQEYYMRKTFLVVTARGNGKGGSRDVLYGGGINLLFLTSMFSGKLYFTQLRKCTFSYDKQASLFASFYLWATTWCKGAFRGGQILYYLKIILSKIIGIYLADKCPGLLFLNFLDLPMHVSVCDHSLQKFSVSKRPIVFN